MELLKHAAHIAALLQLCFMPLMAQQPAKDIGNSQKLKDSFSAVPVPDSIWTRMQGKTYHDNPHIGRNDLRYLRVLHWDYDQQTHSGELVCNKLIADKLINIFRALYNAHYPIQRMVLPDEYDANDERQMRDNNTSCFCYRPIAHTKKLSKHARGLAIDLNPLYNPFCKRRADGTLLVQPKTAAKYCNRNHNFKYKITREDLAYRLFTANGFQWGGAWKSQKDYQHFEY